jgi:hypothetical protein
MALALPLYTQEILATIEAELKPIELAELTQRLFGLPATDTLSDPERKGAWAEASAFNFMAPADSPWGTYYGPVVIGTNVDGSPFYAPDLKEVDIEVITHWERRSEVTAHPVLKARYADLVWDLKKQAVGQRAEVLFARRSIDAYLDAITGKLYGGFLIHALQASERALELAVSVNDADRVERSKAVVIGLFEEGTQPRHFGIACQLFTFLDERGKKVGLTPGERQRLTDGLERVLTTCTTRGGDGFDMFGGQSAAQLLASQYEREGKRVEVERVIRAAGNAFEAVAEEAAPLLALGWLEPVHEDYVNRGMKEDAARVQALIVEKGRNVRGDLKQIRIPIEFDKAQVDRLFDRLTQGAPRDALLQIAYHMVPSTEGIKRLLQRQLNEFPLLAMISITKMSDDGLAAARVGGIEEDPDGRLIHELGQQISFYNSFLGDVLKRLRASCLLTAETIVDLLEESPVFSGERRPLLLEGIQAYLAGDATKAIHVLIPQIEHSLRRLLQMKRVPFLRQGRNGTLQMKTLNEVLRETAIKEVLGEDRRLYLLTLLADERGYNIRNKVCHGLAPPELFSQPLADQILHSLLVVSLVRAEEKAATC